MASSSSSRPPGDYLLANENVGVQKMLQKYGTPSERILFSEKFTKINRKEKHQDRALILTNYALYNCKPNDLGKCKRQIPLNSIQKVTHSTVSDEFVVHVPSEYDYRLMGPRKIEAIEWLQSAREQLEGDPMPVNPSSQVILKDVCLTRVEAERRKDGGTDKPKSAEEENNWKEEGPNYQALKESALSGDALEPIAEDDAEEESEEDKTDSGRKQAPQERQASPAQRKQITLDDDAARDRSQTVGWARKETKVTMEDFDLVKVLGRGSFGKVIAARKNNGEDKGAIYAIKILNKKVLQEREQIEHTQAEREILESIDHPFLVGLKYAFQTPTKLYMVLPMYNGGELFTILKRERKFSEDRTRFYAAEIALGLGHLHHHGITYRDLKPENLLLDTKGHMGLTDFGLSKRLGEGEKSLTFCGTPEYLAPEIINDEGHDKNVDWWSFGVLVYEMMCGRPPFYDRNQQKMYDLITRAELRFPSNVDLSNEAKDFIAKLVRRNSAERLGANGDIDEVKAHPFFDSIDWDKLYNREVEPPKLASGADEFSGFDKEFTSEPVVDSYAAPSSLENVEAFEGFTFVDKSAQLHQ